MKKKILLVGGGGHCKSVIDVIEQQGEYDIAGIIDKKEFLGDDVLGYKIVGCDDDLESLCKKYAYAIVTIGHVASNHSRVKLFKKLKAIGYVLPSIVSPRAYVSKHATIQEGTIVMHHALVNANVFIDQNCIINTKALLEHDVLIGAHCHISTGAIVNGGVQVKENTFIGSNATTKESIEIEGFVKAGQVVK